VQKPTKKLDKPEDKMETEQGLSVKTAIGRLWDVNGKTVTVCDWDSALTAASKLDQLEPGEDRSLIRGKTALLIVAEYGVTFYKAAHPGEEVSLSLAIVIDENVVYIIPSRDGLNGIFIGEYRAEKYGEWVKKLTKEGLWAFSNIDARIDGWTFFSEMVLHNA